MNDHELDQLLRRAQPASAGRVPAVAAMLHEAGQELLEEVMSDVQKSEVVSRERDSVIDRTRVKDVRARRRMLIGAAAAVAVVAAIVTPTVFLSGRTAPVAVVPAASPSVSATPLPTNPFLLLDDAGWKIEYVQEDEVKKQAHGEIRFVRGAAEIQVDWEPASGYRDRFDDRVAGYGKPRAFTLFGEKAWLFSSSRPNSASEVFLERDGYYLDIKISGVLDPSSVEQLIGKLTPVSAEQWYAAMPDLVVTPNETAQEAAGILKDIPLPDGFDTSVFTVNMTTTYDQFGDLVTGVVTCAWLDDYMRARAQGDDAGMAAVDEVLSGAPDWKFLKDTAKDFNWGEVIAEYAARVTDRKPVESYEQGLGCDRLTD